MKKQQNYGAWDSSISADDVVAKQKRIGSVAAEGELIYWTEVRPQENGRSAIVRRNPSGTKDTILPLEYNSRSRVQEYGGTSFMVKDGLVYFTNFKDQQVYIIKTDGNVEKLTNEENSRFVDFEFDSRRRRLYALREVHPQSDSPATEVLNSICTIDLGSGAVKDIAFGNDFYTSARLSKDGNKLCWITWNHPNMPWHGRELWVATLNSDGIVQEQVRVAGDAETCVSLPEWHENGDLYFCMEPQNWMNLYRWDGTSVHPVIEREAELAYPDWTPGMKNYSFLGDKVVFSYTHNGEWFLAETLLDGGVSDDLSDPLSGITFVNTYKDKILFKAERKDAGLCLYELDISTQELSELEAPEAHGISAEDIAVGGLISFENKRGSTSYAWFYPPVNSKIEGLPGTKPPLVVMAHGGPTGFSPNNFRLATQFWTSRGFAVVDVNYGGSTGFGREYRDRLNLNWGLVDVEDCVSAVEYLGSKGMIDSDRVAIRGGSAGGYTTLAGLVFTNTFKVGASYFGVSSLEALAKDTHKFESRYLDGLVGPYPEAIDTYKERAPIEHCENLSCPIIFFQGSDDKVVPPNQAEMMVDILKKKGIEVEYVLYEGEGHGFRKAENIKDSLVKEYEFYCKVLGI